jgi:hypothetical protein
MDVYLFYIHYSMLDYILDQTCHLNLKDLHLYLNIYDNKIF